MALTDDSGTVAEQDSYDARRKRRYPNGSDDPTDSITSQTTRGDISQEELPGVSLLDLNARVDDPYGARFTAADPLGGAGIQHAGLEPLQRRRQQPAPLHRLLRHELPGLFPAADL
ncbi:MAG: hypothetical protein ACRELF_15720 [Gemmataceae bacterium]